MRLFLLGLAVFIGALIATVPVSRVLYTDEKSSLQFFGVEGSLLSGHIGGLSSNRRPLMENLKWRFSPLQLLLLRLGYDVSAQVAGTGDAAPLTARVSRSLLGQWRVRDFRGELGLQALSALAGQTYLPLEGTAQLEIDALDWKPGQPLSLEGTLRLNGLRWTLAQTPLALGDYQATVAPKADTLVASLSALSGPLEVGGEVVFRPDHSYETHLQLRPKPGSDPALLNLLRTLGPPDNQAWYHLRRNGSL